MGIVAVTKHSDQKQSMEGENLFHLTLSETQDRKNLKQKQGGILLMAQSLVYAQLTFSYGQGSYGPGDDDNHHSGLDPLTSFLS